jgi:uncharacterized protein HemX
MAIEQTQPMQEPTQTQPVQTQAAQPVQGQSQVEQMPEKKSKGWLWLIIAVVVIGAGIGSYFLWFAG